MIKFRIKKFLSIVAVFILISLLFSIYSIANAEMVTLDHSVWTTVIFVPYSGFSELSRQHFSYAAARWNSKLSWDPVICSLSSTHNLTNFTGGYGDGNDYVYRYNTGTNNYLMLTHYIYNPTTGELYEADINVNTYYRWANSGTGGRHDIWSAFIHEIGHVLGLGHQDDVPSVMASNLPKDTERRELYTYDINLVRKIYS